MPSNSHLIKQPIVDKNGVSTFRMVNPAGYISAPARSGNGDELWAPPPASMNPVNMVDMISDDEYEAYLLDSESSHLTELQLDERAALVDWESVKDDREIRGYRVKDKIQSGGAKVDTVTEWHGFSGLDGDPRRQYSVQVSQSFDSPLPRSMRDIATGRTRTDTYMQTFSDRGMKVYKNGEEIPYSGLASDAKSAFRPLADNQIEVLDYLDVEDQWANRFPGVFPDAVVRFEYPNGPANESDKPFLER